MIISSVQFSSAQSLHCVWLFATPWTTARQSSLSITNSQSLLKPMTIKSVTPSSHLILCRPLLLLPPIPPSIRVFSSESALRIRWPKYWSFSFSICPSNEQPGLISFRMDWLDLLAVQGALKSTLCSGGDRRLVLAPLIPSPFLFFLWEKVLPPVRDLPWILSVALSGKAPLFLWSICSQCGGGQGQTYRLKG